MRFFFWCFKPPQRRQIKGVKRGQKFELEPVRAPTGFASGQTRLKERGLAKLLRREKLPRLPQIDFIKEPTIVKATEQWWNDFFDTPPSIFMRVNHADTCLAMIMEGLGYSIFPDIGFAKGIDNLFTIPLVHKDGAKFVRETRFVYRSESMTRPVVKDFINFIQVYGIKRDLADSNN